MTAGTQKRSSIDRNPHAAAQAQGVGARQTGAPPPVGGGGYQDVCTLEELRDLRLPPEWMAVAERLGAQQFLELWHALDEELARDVVGRVFMPSFDRWRRRQRNVWIRTLRADGLALSEIAVLIHQRLGERLSRRHIKRIARDAQGDESC